MKALLLGDISPTAASAAAFDAGDEESLFHDVLPLFENRDFILCNLECAVTAEEKGIEKYGPCLKAPLGTAALLKKIGVTHAGLSNNHVFDFGKKGLADTKKALEDVGIRYTGVGENEEDARRDLIIEKNGEKIAVVAVCEHEYSYALPDREGCRGFDMIDSLRDVREAKKKADRVIVLYHGGKEYAAYPSPRLLKVCRAMAEEGADVILCQHSHTIGCYEEYAGCHIVYGQGNFHFVEPSFMHPSPLTAGWDHGMAVSYDTLTDEISFDFVTTDLPGIRLADGALLAELKAGFEERNASLADGSWKDGWDRFVEAVAPEYLARLSEAFAKQETLRAYNIVGHYLDCEAHHDVLAALFQTANRTNEK